MRNEHTPGPWFSDKKGRVWRRKPSDLYENGGSVAGDQPIAFANIGWTGEGSQGYPIESNARLIAAAPELLAALKEVKSRIEDMPQYEELTVEEEESVGGDAAELSYLARVCGEAIAKAEGGAA